MGARPVRPDRMRMHQERDTVAREEREFDRWLESLPLAHRSMHSGMLLGRPLVCSFCVAETMRSVGESLGRLSRPRS